MFSYMVSVIEHTLIKRGPIPSQAIFAFDEVLPLISKHLGSGCRCSSAGGAVASQSLFYHGCVLLMTLLQTWDLRYAQKASDLEVNKETRCYRDAEVREGREPTFGYIIEILLDRSLLEIS